MSAKPVVRVAQKLALLLFAFVVSLGVLELVIRTFTDVHAPIGRRHARVGKTHVPGLQASIYVEEARRHVDLRFNRDGFRGPDLPHEKPPGTRRIALLGDSMVASIATDEEQTAARQLEQMLNATVDGARWEVMNFGVSGASTGQEMVLYRELVAPYDPDIVICAYYLGNDFSDNSRELSSNPRIYFELDDEGELVQLPFGVRRSRISGWLNEHSRLYVWQKRANDIFRDAAGHQIWMSLHKADTERLQRVWELNEKLILAFREAVVADGAEFVLALYPPAEQVDPAQWRGLLDKLGQRGERFEQGHAEARLLEICRRHGIQCVSMDAAFAEALAAPDPPLLYFNGYGHFTADGNLLAAQRIFDVLATHQRSGSVEAGSMRPSSSR